LEAIDQTIQQTPNFRCHFRELLALASRQEAKLASYGDLSLKL
jgi:hypothetical protein